MGKGFYAQGVVIHFNGGKEEMEIVITKRKKETEISIQSEIVEKKN